MSANFMNRLRAYSAERQSLNERMLTCWLLALVTCVVFWRVLGNDFINFDDNSYVSQNRWVQDGLSSASIQAAFSKSFNGHWHPLTTLSYMVDTAIFGNGAGGYHLTNLLLHVANAILLFLILLRMTGAHFPSAAAAMLFAIHPLHVEPVAWIASRKDVLSTFFLLLTIAAYLWYGQRRSARRMGLVVVCMLLGLLSKAMLVTMPVLLLILDYWPLRRYETCWGEGRHARIRRVLSLVKEKLSLFAVSMIFAVITVATQATSGTMSKLDSLSVGARIVNAVESYGVYLAKMVWPRGLAPFYPHDGDYSLGLAFWFGVITLIAGTYISVRLFRRAPYLAMGWVWYVVSVLPVSGILQAGIQAYADRYTYVSLIGPFIAALWALDAIAARVAWGPGIFRVAAIAAGAVLCVVSWRQTAHWKNDETLFSHTLAVTENNYVAHMILGNAYYEHGRVDDAIGEYNKGLAIQPLDASTHAAIALALTKKGEMDTAITHYETALTLDPEHVTARANLGALLLSEGRMDHAVVQFKQTLEDQPDYVMALNGLGLAYAGLGQYTEASATLQRGLDIAPRNKSLHADLGLVLAQDGKAEDARRHFERAVELDPGNADYHNKLAIVLAE